MVARWPFLSYNRCMVRTAILGMDVEAARWMREAPEPTPPPLRRSEWYSTRPSPDTLERAVVVLWYHCGTLRLAENISGVGSQQLSPNGTYTPTTHRDTPSDTLELSTSYPQLIHRFSTPLPTCTILHIGHPTHSNIPCCFSTTFQKKLLPFLPVPL